MKHIEHDEQAALIRWASLQSLARYTFKAGKINDYLVATPNGGKRGIITAKLLQLEGVKRGFP